MRYLKTFVLVLAITALSIAALVAQTSKTETGRVQMPRIGAVSMIGVRLSDVTADNMKSLKLDRLEGALVESVNPNSAAAAAGLREKDVIVMFDGERVRSAEQMTRLVAETPAGREVAMAVMRDGRRTELKISPEAGGWFNPRTAEAVEDEWRAYADRARRHLEEMSRDLPQVMEDMQGRHMGRGRLGVQVQALTPELAQYFGVKNGVLVASVAADSAASRAGVKAGDVITAVNGKGVSSPRELSEALPAGEGHEVTLTVVRDKKEMTLKASVAPATPARPQPQPL